MIRQLQLPSGAKRGHAPTEAHARERQRNQQHIERVLQGDAPPTRSRLALGGSIDHEAEQIFTAFQGVLRGPRRVARNKAKSPS